MSTYHIDDVERLQRINEALVNRVERAMDQQQNAFSLFQTAISLDGQVRRRTDELTATMRRLEKSNVELEREKEVSENAKTYVDQVERLLDVSKVEASQITASGGYGGGGD